MPHSGLRAAALLAGLAALAASQPSAPILAKSAVPRPTATPAAATGPATWSEIDQLVSEQKISEALSRVSRRREAAQRRGDEPEWTLGLIREVQLRIGLHGYETAVRFLRDQPWPKGLTLRAPLELFYAQSLVQYSRMYSWEIRQRERVESTGAVDLKAWTAEQISQEASRAYLRLWAEREALGRVGVRALAEFVEPNTYPPGIRDTLRDAVSYFFTAHLADTSEWSPAQSNEASLLDLAALLRAGPDPAKAQDFAANPLARLTAVLADLETWHAERGEREGALEARIERLRRLFASFDREEDRQRIEADLRERLPAFRDLAWFSMGKAQLAEFVERDGPNGSGDLVAARGIAQEGAAAYPASIGGRRCQSIVSRISAPGYQLQAMLADGPGRRSIRVLHKNVAQLHLRAFRLDLDERLARASSENDLLPNPQEMDGILRGAPPVARWSVDLPATPDLRMHATDLVPPVREPGLYLIAASGGAEFGDAGNPVVGASFLVSDLVLVTRASQGPSLEVQALSGETGEPLAGASITLYRTHWNPPRVERIAAGVTQELGLVRLTVPGEKQWVSRFLVGRRGADRAFERNAFVYAGRDDESEATSCLLFTDRSTYRPLQKVLWKVIGYTGDKKRGRFAVLPGSPVTVTLVDANNQQVDSRSVTTNEYGSAAGEFAIPAGRVLGSWTVRSSLGNAATSVRVEEYKRPSFEVSWKDPEEPLRLNRRARLRGEARYYFGLPVARGAVRWRVARAPRYRSWSLAWWRPDAARPQTVAAGVSPLAPDGTFEVAFTPQADERPGSASKDATWQYTVDADATDEGGETHSASRSFRLGFVSVEARVDSPPGFVLEKRRAGFTLVRTDLDGVPRAGPGSWTVYRLDQPPAARLPADEPPRRAPAPPAGGARTETAGDRVRPRWDTAFSPEQAMRLWPDGRETARGEATHDAKGEAAVNLPPLPPGPYRLRYRTADESGAVFELPYEFVVAGGPTRLALAAVLFAESESVPVGGTARFLVTSGLPDQPLFFERYTGGRLVERRRLDAGRSPALVEIPVGEEDRGGFSVRIVGVRDHQLLEQSRSLFVPWDDKELKVSFETFRDRLVPGTRETWRVRVEEAGGRAVGRGSAELLAYMYDRSLDAFAPHAPESVFSLYPNRTGLDGIRATLGSTVFFPIRSRFPDLPQAVLPAPDRLKFPPGYSIGGPGRRGGVAGRIEGGVEGAVPMAPMAASVTVQGEASAVDRLGQEEPLRVREDKAGSGAAVPPPPSALRSEFAETAFWRPQLRTDESGSASIEFTVPDSVTAWNVWVHAVTRELKGGSVRKDTRSVKDLMVRPSMPRFLREGDRAELEIVVNNASASEMTGRLRIDVLDAATNASVRDAFGVPAEKASLPFTAEPGRGTSVTVTLTAPKKVGQYAIEVRGTAGDASDGERRPLPVLPGRMQLAQSRFVTLFGRDRREMTFPDLARRDDPTRIDEQLVVTVDAQLFDSVLQALPYLVNYPYECTEQTLNRFVSTGIVSSLFRDFPAVAKMAEALSKRETRLETWDAADPNRKMAFEETPWLAAARGGGDGGRDLARVLDPQAAKAVRDAAIEKLRKAQTPSGGFPWWPGGPPSSYMTVYILHGLANALEFGVDVPKDMVQRAWGFARGEIWRELEPCLDRGRGFCEMVTFLNYTLSSYPDSSWYRAAFSDADRRRLLDSSFRHWKAHPPYLKGQLALTLKRMGRAADAKLVWGSVMDSAKTDRDLGTFWAPEDRAWLWYNDTIETHAFALRALTELAPQDPRRHGLVQWLFLNKKLNQWKSTRATAEVLFALVHYFKREGSLAIREDAKVTAGGRTVAFAFEPDRYTGARNQVVVPGAKIDPRRDATILVEKESKGMAFASATWNFSTEKLPDSESGDFFSVSRRYFRREPSTAGFVLKPLAEGVSISAGDEVEVQLSLRAKHAAEYVHLRDPRAAGMEPETANSRHRWDLGIAWYEETRDSGSNFFFERLPAGEYTFRYRLRVSMGGRFRVGPATVESMYAPEFHAYSAGAVIPVEAATPRR